MKRLKLILMLLLVLLVSIVVLQNTEPVDTRILLATVSMPRAVLLLTTVVVGFVLGVLTALVWMRKGDGGG